MERLPITKTAKAKAFLLSGDYKSCLRIMKTFNIGLAKEDKRIIEIAYECLTGKSSFYRQLGFDVNSKISDGKQIADKYFSNKKI